MSPTTVTLEKVLRHSSEGNMYHGHFINLYGASLEIGLNKSDLVERLGAGNSVSLE